MERVLTTNFDVLFIFILRFIECWKWYQLRDLVWHSFLVFLLSRASFYLFLKYTYFNTRFHFCFDCYFNQIITNFKIFIFMIFKLIHFISKYFTSGHVFLNQINHFYIKVLFFLAFLFFWVTNPYLFLQFCWHYHFNFSI